METQYVCIYTWNIQRTMTLVLYVLVCTWAIQGIYLPVHGSSIFILFHTLKKQNLSLLKVFPWGMPYVLAWTACIQCCTMLVYSLLYMQGSYRSVPPKNGSGRWSAFLWHFFKNKYIRVCQRLYMVLPCTVTSVHEKGKMPQNCLNIYIHVCIMFRHVCTVLPILVQVVRIPDDYFGTHSVCTGMYLSVLLYTGISWQIPVPVCTRYVPVRTRFQTGHGTY